MTEETIENNNLDLYEDTFSFKNSSMYTGQYRVHPESKTRLMHGKGKQSTLYESQEGEFKDGKFHGMGIYRFKSGSVQEGHFKHNKFEGSGKYIQNDGNIQEGHFKNGLFDGRGKLQLSNGTSQEGIFVKGAFNSVKQEYFKKVEENNRKVEDVKKHVSQFFVELDSVFLDKKVFKEKMATFLASAEDMQDAVVDYKPATVAQFNLEKWRDLAEALKDTEQSVLTSKKDSRWVPAESLLKRMLEGPGQIVEAVSKQEDGKVRYFVLLHAKSEKTDEARFCILAAGEE